MDGSFIIANRTDVGRVREVNEDSMVTFDSPNGRVVAVCDGMGGQAAGDVASKLACAIISDILTNNKFDTPTEAITRACLAANQGIIHKASQNPELEGMGATCVIVILKDGLVYYGWIGDSRIYYINQGNIVQLTRDQSYVQQLVDQGQITVEEAEHHPQKNQILNALGLPNMTPPELCSAPLSPQSGSVVLLCSDGLSGMVNNNIIESIVSQYSIPLQRRADLLVEKALENGGSDNITVQLIQFGKDKAIFRSAPVMGNSGNWGMWALVGGVAVIIAALFIWLFAWPSDETEQVTSSPVIQQSAPSNKPSPKATEEKTVTTTVIKEEPKNSNKQKKEVIENKKKEELKDNKAFGQRSKGDKEAIDKVSDTQGSKKNSSEQKSLEELMKDK